MGLYTEIWGGGDGTCMVLLHGMGATGAVWRRCVAELADAWSGSIVVYDLPGHGDSAALDHYTYDGVAAAVADVIPECETLVAIGHSFGGVIAVRLASGRFGVSPAAVLASSVKVTWTPDELASAAAFASKPPRLFDTFDEAVERYRRVSGLTSDVTDDADDLARGVAGAGSRFRLSQDPAIGAVGDPEMASALAAATCPVQLSRGASDRMVGDTELEAFGVERATIPGGHNVHVERPLAFVTNALEFVRGAIGSRR